MGRDFPPCHIDSQCFDLGVEFVDPGANRFGEIAIIIVVGNESRFSLLLYLRQQALIIEFDTVVELCKFSTGRFEPGFQ